MENMLRSLQKANLEPAAVVCGRAEQAKWSPALGARMGDYGFCTE